MQLKHVHKGSRKKRPMIWCVYRLVHVKKNKFSPRRMPLAISSQKENIWYHTVTPVTIFFFFAQFYFLASGQAVVTGVVPSSPRFLPSIFITHRVEHSHCSSIFHRMLLTHALANSASQFERKKKSQRIYTSMHSWKRVTWPVFFLTASDCL